MSNQGHQSLQQCLSTADGSCLPLLRIQLLLLVHITGYSTFDGKVCWSRSSILPACAVYQYLVRSTDAYRPRYNVYQQLMGAIYHSYGFNEYSKCPHYWSSTANFRCKVSCTSSRYVSARWPRSLLSWGLFFIPCRPRVDLF